MFAAAGVESVAQQQWEAYQPRTLSELVKQHLNELSNQATKSTRITYLLTSNEFPSRVRVVYTGHIRALRPEKKEVILEWAKARGMSQEVVDLFKDELLFLENGREYWIPVQKQLLPAFEQELKKGDATELFVIWIGARKEKEIEWVFWPMSLDMISCAQFPQTKPPLPPVKALAALVCSVAVMS